MWLHLGCGKRNIPGFVNVDLADFKHIHYKRKADDLSPFKNNSADLIYASHVFEYFDREEAPKVLKEWKRVLKKGGTLRLAVPDFEALANVYEKYKDLNLVKGPLYGKWKVKGKNKYVYHKTVYDFDSLKNLLEKNGFTNVRRYDWKTTEPHTKFDDHSQAYIPHMDKENGILISLNVEANKK
ncbi:MAG: methyltransferase domain-containing protein [Bacteroidetes bacterium]|nr:methyltransferase domain-containing protein [Bacteroidota bacterium]